MKPIDALKNYYGFSEFRPPQAEVIERTLQGGHSLVIMPTGGGKSLCYQIPALLPDFGGDDHDSRQSLVLVLSPLIALMKDQVDALIARDIDATLINSSLSRNERETRYKRLAAGKFRLLYVTPERFRKREFLDALSHRRVTLLAVDEAHCISEWGHDFRPDYSRLNEFRQQIGNPVTIALTATATPEVQDDIVRQLGLTDDVVQRFHLGIDRPNLELRVEKVWGDEEKLDRIQQVVSQHASSAGSGIVYFTLIKTLERFSEALEQKKISHVCYHGDLDRVRRRQIQNQFMRGDCPLALATPAFGMGIDKEDIRYVIHAEIPGSMEAWYQEIGRAGRDGRPSTCLLLYDENDLLTQMEFMKWSNPNAEYYHRVYDLIEHHREQVDAFGLDWMREKLHDRQKSDRRLETAIGMLERYAVIEVDWDPLQIRLVGKLPEPLRDAEALALKLRRDQQKLLSLVQFVHHDGDPREYLAQYFGSDSVRKPH